MLSLRRKDDRRQTRTVSNLQFMHPNTWQDVALAFIAGLPGLVAAWSSLKNGAEQRRVKKELQETNGHLRRTASGKR